MGIRGGLVDLLRLLQGYACDRSQGTAVQELQIGQVMNNALYFFLIWIHHLRKDFAKSELKSLPATLESGCALVCWGECDQFLDS